MSMAKRTVLIFALFVFSLSTHGESPKTPSGFLVTGAPVAWTNWDWQAIRKWDDQKANDKATWLHAHTPCAQSASQSLIVISNFESSIPVATKNVDKEEDDADEEDDDDNDPVKISAPLKSLVESLDSCVLALVLATDLEKSNSSFQTYLRSLIEPLHELRPNLKIGLAASYSILTPGQERKSKAVRELLKQADVVLLSYSSVDSKFLPRSPYSILSDIPTALQLAANRHLILYDLAYPSSASLSSNASAQAGFISNLFKAWAKAPKRLDVVFFKQIQDPELPLCKDDTQIDLKPEQAFQCSIGLLHSDGTPKPAWQLLQEGFKTKRGLASDGGATLQPKVFE